MLPQLDWRIRPKPPSQLRAKWVIVVVLTIAGELAVMAPRRHREVVLHGAAAPTTSATSYGQAIADYREDQARRARCAELSRMLTGTTNATIRAEIVSAQSQECER